MRMSQWKCLCTVIIALTVISAGCGKPGAPPQAHVVPAPPAPPPVVTPQLPAPPPRPEPWTGPGLATPYINDKGELELVYGDNRGTVKLGEGKGKVVQASLSPDRQQLVYVVELADKSWPDDYQQPYYVSVASGALVERKMTEASDMSPVGELAWSPCSQYLVVDSGTSAVRGLLLLRPSASEVIGGCTAVGFAWSPGAPSRLAIGMVTSRPVVMQTEVDRATDLVLLDLPSSRLTYLVRGSTIELWSPKEWTAERGLVAHHSFLDYRPDNYRSETIPVPPRSVSADALPLGEGPLPAGLVVRPEVDFGCHLLLVDERGVVQRELSNSLHGSVIDAAMSDDGSRIACAWLGKGEELISIRTISCPDLTVTEMPLTLSDFERRIARHGYGPQRLEFAPGSTRILLANYECLGCDDRVQVYDLASGKLLLDRDLWMPLWVPGTGDLPRLVAGALTDGTMKPEAIAIGDQLSLIEIDVMSGSQTVIKPGSKSESWWPLRFPDQEHVTCLLTTTNSPFPDRKVERVDVEMPK